MRAIIFISLAFMFSGCASTMTANGSCAYKAGVDNGRSWSSSAPEGACSFSLQAPIKSANEAKTYAEAFRNMLLAMPVPDGVTTPKLEVKIEEKK